MPIQQVEIDKKLIFTVTPGRSGTSYLAQLLAAIPGVSAHHEPDPNFVQVMRRIQMDPAMAYHFLYEHKLPAIARNPSPIYIETSHLTCKGFIEPMLRMGLRPSLIILRRPPREVAWSYLLKETVPTRTTLGIRYLLEPRDLNVLPLIRWESASDYQLCYWYALEIERRQMDYIHLAREFGITVADVTNEELNDWNIYAALLTALDLPITPDTQSRHSIVSSIKHNSTVLPLNMPSNLEAEEEAIWESVGHFNLVLRDHIDKRYAGNARQDSLNTSMYQPLRRRET